MALDESSDNYSIINDRAHANRHHKKRVFKSDNKKI